MVMSSYSISWVIVRIHTHCAINQPTIDQTKSSALNFVAKDMYTPPKVNIGSELPRDEIVVFESGIVQCHGGIEQRISTSAE